MIDFEIKLQTGNILLRPAIREDIAGFAGLNSDKSMWIYFTNNLSDKFELESWVEDALIQKENKTRLPFTIVDKKTNNLIS